MEEKIRLAVFGQKRLSREGGIYQWLLLQFIIIKKRMLRL